MPHYITQDDFDALEKRVTQLEGKAPPTASLTKKPQSIREFFLEKHPTSQPEKAICFLFFLELSSQSDSPSVITTKDVEDAFIRAKEPRPGNTPQILSNCEHKGWVTGFVDKSTRKKCWSLTNAGIAHVEQLGGTQ